MNAVERVIEKFVHSEAKDEQYDKGYSHALNDVQKELNEEVSRCNLEKTSLKDKHRCEIEELKQRLCEAERERDEYKNKYEVVELIFGGK